MLEEFFGTRAGALFFEDASRHYSEISVKKAMLAGDVIGRRVICGPDSGRLLLWLSQEGRKKARHIRAPEASKTCTARARIVSMKSHFGPQPITTSQDFDHAFSNSSARRDGLFDGGLL